MRLDKRSLSLYLDVRVFDPRPGLPGLRTTAGIAATTGLSRRLLFQVRGRGGFIPTGETHDHFAVALGVGPANLWKEVPLVAAQEPQA